MKKKNNENKYKIFLFIFEHFVNGQPSDQYPDSCPATGGLVFEARRRPKKLVPDSSAGTSFKFKFW